jgi:hypothetical protein
MRSVARICAVTVALCAFAGTASATAPPVGKLPTAQVVRQDVRRGSLVALALPATKAGTVWRVARPFDGHVAAEVEERTLRSSIVIVFRAGAPGHTRIVYALTAGETSSKALRAIVLDVRVG